MKPPYDRLTFDPYSFDVDMHCSMYDPVYTCYGGETGYFGSLVSPKAICEEYSDEVRAIPAGRYVVYSVVIKTKYFMDMFSKMKSIGYCCCTAKILDRDHHAVKFGPALNDEYLDYEDDEER
jgi:hypothetical protein